MLPTSLIAAGITTVSPNRRSRVVRSMTATISMVSGPALKPSGTATSDIPDVVWRSHQDVDALRALGQAHGGDQRVVAGALRQGQRYVGVDQLGI